ncbi:ATP-binding protein [Pseudosulfitobacter sp. SM2401]|uniref:sensor histidine kinase n=1 Tax=Pseudosulfitobacter sp. SM2401 TaxID=3350098 RepID=UPI0036F2C115
MGRGVFNRLVIVLAFLALVAAVSGGVWRYGYVQALTQLARQGAVDLALASDRLTGQLQRYRELSVLTADRGEVTQAIRGQNAASVKALLLDIADKTAALDVMLVDRTGRVVQAARSDAGADLSQTVYVRRAMQGALGWAHGLSRPLAARAYYYAAPVFDGQSKVIGAVVVAANIAGIEWDWVGGNPAVFFTDQAGEVFISNRSELVFWRRPAGQAGLVPPVGQAPDFDSYFQGRFEVWQLGWGPYLPQNALHITRELPVIGFTGEVLMDVRPARRLARLQASAVAALFLAFGALLFLATERRRTLAEANAQLEARVAARTAELEDTNTQLRAQAKEREQAQTALARAQSDLVQAGKLSALGQMSAGISHELNQPLMAIRSFAENGAQFMERGKPERAGENLIRISDLARRMGRIIKNLRAFAKQESEPLSRVDLVAVLDSALELMQPGMDQAGVVLNYARSDHPIWVRGGEVRLSQVFINLISNAVDAMDQSVEKSIEISIKEGDLLVVSICDTGPGIDMPDKVFDPFYTTKEVGASEGMGLGLSISYGIVQSFGGEIRGANTPSGAMFTVQLERWDEGNNT